MTRLLTAREVSERLSVSVETVLRWYRRGDLPGVRLSSNVLRFESLELERFVGDRSSGRGKAPRSALTPTEGDSTRGTLLPFCSNPSSSSRRGTANTTERNQGDD